MLPDCLSTVEGGTTGQDIPGGNAGISITASRDVEVYDNIRAWNKVGISVVNSLRGKRGGH
jgi:hypothetical protein